MTVKCKHCGLKSEKSIMIKIEKGSTKYYVHEECEIRVAQEKSDAEKLKQEKKKQEEIDKAYHKRSVDLFYEYTQSLAPITLVNLAFKKCKEKGLTNKDISYTMEYIVKNKMVLNYPMGVLYYIDRAMRDKREVDKIEKTNNIVSKSEIKFIPLINKKNDKKIDNESDISDLL